MPAAALPLAKTAQARLGLRPITLKVTFAVAAALFCGFVVQDGPPGSVIVLAPLATFTVLAARLRGRTLTGAGPVYLVLGLGSLIAVAIDPGPLNLVIAWLALGMLALFGRGHGSGNLARLANILFSRALLTPAHALHDGRTMRAAARRKTRVQNFDWRHAVLPLLAALVFAFLLTAANPLIDIMVRQMPLTAVFDLLWSWMPATSLLAFLALWALLRMKPAVPTPPLDIDRNAPPWHHSYFAPGPVIATMLALNGMFLVQNLLDLSYIWSGAELPPGMTYAAYVNRGAGTLIVTVLFAAALIIVALWPGSRTEASAAVRWLVYGWIAQNAFLVASCIERTLSYVDAYGMSMLRLAGLAWMGLIAVGLALIAARIVLARGNQWLLNGNLAAAFLLLWGSGFADYRAIVADYNVTRALDGMPLDVSYLRSLGPSALPALRRMAAAPLDTPLPFTGPARLAAQYAINALDADLATVQASWRHWTWRGTRLSAHQP